MDSFSSSGNDPIARELDAGERVLWSGQPDPARLWSSAVPTALLSVSMMAFMAFGMWGASAPLRMALALGRIPGFMDVAGPALGLTFIAVAIGLAISPWMERARASRTFYALTNRRALIVVEGQVRTTKSVLPTEFTIKCRDLPNGQGDVVFKHEVRPVGRTRARFDIGFFGIAQAREVERMARELAQGTR